MSDVPNTDRPGLDPPRFQLRTLLLGVAAICATLAVVSAFGAYGALAAGSFLTIVVAHLAAASIGHRLRDNGDRPVARDGKLPAPRTRLPVQPHQFARPTRLRQSGAPVVALLIASVAGGLCGAVLGGGALTWFNWRQANVSNVIVAVFATAVLGAIAGFCAGGFTHVFVGSNVDAMQDGKLLRHSPPPR